MIDDRSSACDQALEALEQAELRFKRGQSDIVELARLDAAYAVAEAQRGACGGSQRQ